MYDPRNDQKMAQKQKLQQMLMGALMGGGGGMGGGAVDPQSSKPFAGLMNMLELDENQPDRMGRRGAIHGNVSNMLTAGIPPSVMQMLMASFGGR